jgi:antitoxin ParD1/3/4
LPGSEPPDRAPKPPEKPQEMRPRPGKVAAGITIVMAIFANALTALPSKHFRPMSTATMNISLPGSLKGYIKERMEEEHYDNASDYIRAIIREERRRREEKKLEQMLLEGINSGPVVEFGTKEWDVFWEGIHARIRDEASKKRIHV